VCIGSARSKTPSTYGTFLCENGEILVPRAGLHARSLLALEPDSKFLEREAQMVLALADQAQGSRDASGWWSAFAARAQRPLGSLVKFLPACRELAADQLLS